MSSIENEAAPGGVSELPEMLQKIEANWPILPSGMWNNSSIQLLSRHLLEFSKRSNQLGEEKLQRLVDAIGEIIDRVVEDNSPPDDRQMETLNRYREELRAMVGEARAPSREKAAATGAPASPARRFDLVYLPEPGEEVEPLVDTLEAGGLRYRILSDPQGLQEILADPGMQALLLDASFLGTQELEPILHLCKINPASAPALLIISDQSTIEMRLRALRTGAAHLLSKPVSPQQLLDSLQPYIHPQPEPRRRILIVEDDESQANFAAKLLQKGGMDSLSITDPLGVIEAVARFQPDLILMDLYMPGADGIELTRLIRERWESSAIPVVFLSGEDDPDKKLLTLHAGADDFLTKPVRPQQLLATVNTRIERARHIAATACRLVTEASRLLSRRELLSRLDLMLAEGEEAPSRALLVICCGEPPAPHEQESEAEDSALLRTLTDALAPLLRPEDSLANLGGRRLALLYQRQDQAGVEQLAEQVYETLGRETAGSEHCPIGLGMTRLDAAERNAYAQLCHAEASAASAFRQGLSGYELYGEAPPSQVTAVDELTAERNAMRQLLTQDSLECQKRRFNARAVDAQETFELIPMPFPSAPQEDPYRAAAGADLAREFDRFVYRQALRELGDRVMQGRLGRLIFRQSVTVLKDPDYPEFIRSELRRRQLVGTGLMVEFDLPSLAAELMRARALIGELAGFGISVALGNFACSETSYKVFAYLRATAVRPHRALLRIDDERIRQIARQLQSLHAEIILPRVTQQNQIALAWTESADYIQADLGGSVT